MNLDFNLKNPILNVDSYKPSQFNQLPPNTNKMYAYIEARKAYDKNVMFFGLQMFLMDYLSIPITKRDIEEADDFFGMHGEPFNRSGWERILNVHGGYFPVKIHALAEGEVVPPGTVMATIENTDDELPWVTSYVETPLLRSIWYPSTVASNSFHSKKIILRYLKDSSDDPMGQIPFKLHDFGARGTSSFESAGIGGCAHLVNFSGTDTITGVLYAKKFYGELMAGYSIPAMEHSTVTAWGRHDEIKSYRNMINQYAKPNKMFACVVDSYNMENVVNNMFGDTLMEQIKNSGAIVVIRPDSGNPISIPTEVIRMLSGKFGFTTNKKKFDVLHPSVKVIQGDGINHSNIDEIYSKLLDSGFSADNLTLGMGGGLLQAVHRDDYSFAQKNSAIENDGVWSDTYKDPITDAGKRSKRGRFMVIKKGKKFVNMPLAENSGDYDNQLKLVWDTGKHLIKHTFSDIRARSERNL